LTGSNLKRDNPVEQEYRSQSGTGFCLLSPVSYILVLSERPELKLILKVRMKTQYQLILNQH
ncbi:MAG: hypothetical protein QNJ46_34500, partial [Leptolyngbyaceae cyanobacterium MO_188.B28]|nr:hypothetical protein [Leptolyngbyaceae cyanobacterium MO_188.B28]